MNRLLLDRDFVVESLGGIEEVMKIGSQFGIDILDLLSESDPWYMNRTVGLRNSDGSRDLSFVYHNYREVPDQFTPYPDLHIRVEYYINPNKWDSIISESYLSDIGYRQTRDQAKESIENWFHTEVTPILLEYIFI